MISTAFFINDGKAFNVKKGDSVNIYLKCICVFFASMNRFHPTSRKVLFINQSIQEKYYKILEYYSVEITIIDEEHLRFVNSKILSNSFPGCLFSLDVINYIAKNSFLYHDVESFYLLDNDVLFLKSLTDIDFNLKGNIKGYPVLYDFQLNVNGKSRAILSLVNQQLGFPNIITWFGGELLGLEIKGCESFIQQAEIIFKHFEDNCGILGNYVTEEHIYSIIISNVGSPYNTNLIKRVWTTYGYNNIDGTEEDHKILHYPSEKTRLFVELFSEILNDPLYFDRLDYSTYKEIVLSPIQKFQYPNLKVKLIKKMLIIKNNFCKFFCR